MSALEAAILALVTKIAGKPAPGPSPSFIPSPSVPNGLTLRHTITASGTPDKSAWPEWVYVVAVGGGGSATADYGGGGGACFQGWVKKASVDAVTIGAGGSPGPGSPTVIGPVRAPGGARGNALASLTPPGAGEGGLQGTGSSNVPTELFAERETTAYGMFVGGVATRSNANFPAVATSGAGGSKNSGASGGSRGGDGFQGPAGGGAISGGNGGSSTSPTGATYTGGLAFASTGAGGGAGILANGGGATTPGIGGSGGLGGGGGGGGTTPGNGGDGAVLIYY